MQNRRSSQKLAAALAMIVGAAPLSALAAQVVHTRTGTAAGSVAPATATPAPARVAGIAPASPTFIVVSGDVVPIPNNATVIFADIPGFVLTDGRVFANFGRGIEQITRPCGTIVNTTGELFQFNGQPVATQPSVLQPVAGATQPLPFTPNVPNQPTVSQQMIVQALSTGPVIVNPVSCWAANRVGQVFVTRP